MVRTYLFTAALTFAVVGAASGAFRINEIDSDQPNTPVTDPGEFVELKGDPNESVAGLTLVFFNGQGGVNTPGSANPPAYRAYDLVGTANASGFYIVANPGVVSPNPAVTFPSNTLQNGEDAVALYSGTNAAAWGTVTSATLEAPPTGAVLIDAVAYETGTEDGNADWSTFPNSTVYNEATGVTATGAPEASLSRVPDGTGNFQRTDPTPLAPNQVITAVREWELFE